MKIGLIIDHDSLVKWQADALRTIADDCEFVVYNCTNSRPSLRSLKHAFYYALNLVSLRTRLTARVPLPGNLRIGERIDFECEQDGDWQALPASLLDRIAREPPQAIVKFGMGLLRVPPDLPCPVLSYHHGDPREFRGRPAGFHEMLAGRGSVGQIVQVLSNRLDAGEVVAFAETKAHAHSWRRTMAEAYSCSPLLLPIAIRNATGGTRLPIAPTKKVHKLPSNGTVIRFVLARLAAWLSRLAYGAFVEKAWEVAEAPLPDGEDFMAGFPAPSQWRTVPRPRPYRFLADPFFHADGGILVEALRASSGLGEILHITSDGTRILLGGDGHYSYPGSLPVGGESYLVPEVCEWSPPLLFRLSDEAAEPLGGLKVAGGPRLIDPTLFHSDGTIFLFANRAPEGSGILRLWFSASIAGEFVEHPASPIRISPAGARMGGAITIRNGMRFRVGQDLRRQYGDGIILFRIETLSRTDYREVEAGELRFADRRGPHTLNFGSASILFDFYRDRFSLLAGLRRIHSALTTRTDKFGTAAKIGRATRSSAM